MDTQVLTLKAAVEGPLDEVVLNAVLRTVGASAYPVYGKNGKNGLRKQIGNYHRSAQYEPWVVLVDLNQQFDCAPLLCKDWIGQPSRYLCFRVAVRAVESWLLADRERIATFLKIPIARVPTNPDLLDDPKQAIVNLARQSRSRALTAQMVPSLRSQRKVGPAYTSALMAFIIDFNAGWRPVVAAETSESLGRFLAAVKTLKQSIL
jgi:hypothetical protein